MDIEGNRSAQAEEMEALQSIYGEDCSLHPDEHLCQVTVYPLEDMGLSLKLRVYFPATYPSTSEPIAEVDAPWLTDDTRLQLDEGLRRLYSENAGNVVVFTWIEWLKDQNMRKEIRKGISNLLVALGAAIVKGEVLSNSCAVYLSEQDWFWKSAKESLKGKESSSILTEDLLDEDGIEVLEKASLQHHTTSMSVSKTKKENVDKIVENESLEELDKILRISHGAPFTEKKSTFQAHLAPVNNLDQVETVMDTLMRNRKIAGATHNIMAYRIDMLEKGTVLQDYDDDGETAAGGRLLHLLQIVNASNVVVVVSRWFGGILLGPDRFKHINNAARSLLGISGYINGLGQSSSHGNKQTSKAAILKGKRR